MNGQIVILNGPSRSGKTSIARALQDHGPGMWMNIGMDNHIAATPAAYKPGVGLRPQRIDPDHREPGRVSVGELEDVVPTLYHALYGSIAAHARLGLNVATDVYHHNFYTRSLDILPGCAAQLDGLSVLFVGVACPIDEIWERRRDTWGQHRDEIDDRTREAVELAQVAASELRYDLQLDTSELTPEQCAETIVRRLADPAYTPTGLPSSIWSRYSERP